MGIVLSIKGGSHLVTRPTRAERPDDVRRVMDDWILGGCSTSVPQLYQIWNAQLASEELDRITERYNLEVMNDPRIIDDEWTDGLKVLEVDIVTRRRKMLRLCWDDAKQAFLVKLPKGRIELFEKDLV